MVPAAIRAAGVIALLSLAVASTGVAPFILFRVGRRHFGIRFSILGIIYAEQAEMDGEREYIEGNST